MSKSNSGFLIALTLSLLIFSMQPAFATGTFATQSDRTEVAAMIPSLKVAHAIIRQYSPNEDFKSIESGLVAAGVDLSAPPQLELKNKTLFLAGEKVAINTYGVTYKNKVYKYDFAKSYSQNLETFSKELAGRNTSALGSLLLDSAQAADPAKSSLANNYMGTATALTILAFLIGAPKWVLVSGVASILVLGGISLAYADEMKNSGLLDLRDFNCIANGWSMSLKDGSKIDATKNEKAAVIIDVSSKDGVVKTKHTATTAQVRLYNTMAKICEAGNSETLKEFKKQLATVAPAASASEASSDGTAIKK